MDPSSVQRIMAEAVAASLTRQRPPPRYAPVGEGYPFNPNYAHVEHAFIGVFPFLGRVLKIMAVGILLLAISAGSYALFYRSVMPSLSAAHPLFFDYTGPMTPSFLGKPQIPLQDCTETFTSTLYGKLYNNNRDQTPDPWAVVDLFARHSSWEALEMEVLPKPIAENRLLKAKQAYYIEVVLTLPDSNLNREPGMFGVVTELYSHNGTRLAVSRRSTRFPHQSHWITVVRKVLCLIPLLIGAIDESRTVVVPSFRHFVESSGHPMVSFVCVWSRTAECTYDTVDWYVSHHYYRLSCSPMQQHAVVKIILPTTSSQGNHHQVVEVTGGDLLIGKELNSFQELLKVWFYTCYLVGTLVFVGFYILQWFLFQIIWQVFRQRFSQEEEPAFDFDFDLDDADPDDMFQDIDPSRDGEPPVEQDGHGSRQERAARRVSIDTDEEAWDDLFYPAAMDDAGPEPDAPTSQPQPYVATSQPQPDVPTSQQQPNVPTTSYR
jgi:hypothetical protein